MVKQLILASSSPRRKALLEKLGILFIVDAADIDESCFNENDPRKLVEKLSQKKAEKVAPRHKNAIIIGADTVVALGSTILEKPKDKNHAKEMLCQLSGKKHSIITGFTILDTLSDYQHTESVSSTIYFKRLTTKDIDDYVDTGESMDKAGAYAIQGKGAKLIKQFKGNLEAAIGLPITRINQILKQHYPTTPPFSGQI